MDKELQRIYDGWSNSQTEWEQIKNELDIAERDLMKPLKDGVAVMGINPPPHLITKVESLRDKLDDI